jgi:uncharacterized membrane protein YagU involved in acid resistance
MSPDTNRPRALPAIFWAGLTCGVLDISAAFITWALKGVKPFRILQGIASGLLGARSFDLGWPAAALGAACHFFIAFSAATVFYAASRKLAFMARRAIVSGALYGIAVYVVMYWIVKPLSLARPRPFSVSETVIAILTHIVCVGLPISLIVRRFSR